MPRRPPDDSDPLNEAKREEDRQWREIFRNEARVRLAHERVLSVAKATGAQLVSLDELEAGSYDPGRPVIVWCTPDDVDTSE